MVVCKSLQDNGQLRYIKKTSLYYSKASFIFGRTVEEGGAVLCLSSNFKKNSTVMFGVLEDDTAYLK